MSVAHNVASTTAGISPAELVLVASGFAHTISSGLARLGLALSTPKCVGLLIDPKRHTSNVFRRTDCGERLGTACVAKRDAMIKRPLDKRRFLGVTIPELFPDHLMWELLCPHCDCLKILSATFDCKLNFHIHIENVLNKSSILYGVMARLAGSTWGLGTSVLQMTQGCY